MAALVIGLGNFWRGDDAAGLEAARRLRSVLPEAQILEWDGEPVGLLDRWEVAGSVIVIDALESGGAPGDVLRFDATHEPIPAAYSRRGTHAIGLAEVIELARALHRLPQHIVVFGIEGRSFEQGGAISDEVARGIETAVGMIGAELRAPAR